MKKITFLLIAAIAVVFLSCEGEMGPEGPPGEDGLIGSIFEIEGDFTAENNYSMLIEYPSELTVYDTDVVLVYILWDVVDGMDVWRLCPQTVVLDEGIIQYNFDFTYADVQVFLEFTVPEGSLLPAETDNQVFRVAVLPADFAALKSADVSDLNSILTMPGLELKTFDKIDLTEIPTIEVK